MGSKISKQKQIFSLLHNKYGNLWGNSATEVDDLQISKSEKFSHGYSSHLINKVYNFYKSIIQSLNSGLIALDLGGEITFINQMAAQMLDYSKEELLGKNIKEIFSKDDASQKCMRAIFIPHKHIDDREVNLKKQNGTIISVGLSSSQIHDENNNFDGIIILFRDLTEIQHLKSQVERMDRLALMGELAAGIAHEVRNPLAGIRASAQLLQEGVKNEKFQKDIVERIIREVDKANKLLKEFFKFAKPSKPNLKFHDIEILIEDVHLLLSPQMKRQKVQFNMNMGEHIPKVFVDETQLEQVFMNIFLNAIEAMPEGGSINISTCCKKFDIMGKKVDIEKEPNNQLNFVIVEISDTGVGIAQDNIEKIFNPFYSSKPTGLGLGLSISSRLVDENGGNIDVSSKIGKGTTFKIALPAFIHH
jgi:PAS domain S-box-containing protein